MDNRELTLTDLLADPMTLAVMAADRVDPAALEAVLSGLARRLESPAGSRGRFSGARRKRFREFFTPRQTTAADQMRQSGVGNHD